jgi:hypothetical protein
MRNIRRYHVSDSEIHRKKPVSWLFLLVVAALGAAAGLLLYCSSATGLMTMHMLLIQAILVFVLAPVMAFTFVGRERGLEQGVIGGIVGLFMCNFELFSLISSHFTDVLWGILMMGFVSALVISSLSMVVFAVLYGMVYGLLYWMRRSYGATDSYK